MQKIQSLKHPERVPTPEAIKSWKQNEHHYEPDFWEFQYEIYRYLQNIDNDKLAERYRGIHRNFYVLVRPERDVIPVNSFLSSWYWYRKEHQTRYEFYLRNLPLPVPLPSPRGDFAAPIRPKGPNSCDILRSVRYDKDVIPYASGDISCTLPREYKTEGSPYCRSASGSVSCSPRRRSEGYTKIQRGWFGSSQYSQVSRRPGAWWRR